MILFLYPDEYPVIMSSERSFGAPSLDQLLSEEKSHRPECVLHTAMFGIAEKYGINDLKALSRFRLEDILK